MACKFKARRCSSWQGLEQGSDDLVVVVRLCFLGVIHELSLKNEMGEMFVDCTRLVPDLEYEVCGQLLISLSGWNVFAS